MMKDYFLFTYLFIYHINIYFESSMFDMHYDIKHCSLVKVKYDIKYFIIK
jgi:hypothetical protein